MVKLKTNLTHRYGREVNLPVVGKVTFSDKGEISVTEEEATALLKEDGIGLEKVSDKKDSSSTTTTTLNPDNGGAGAGGSLYTVESLNKMKVPELKDVADKSGLPEDEWQGLRKDDLIIYLLDKLK